MRSCIVKYCQIKSEAADEGTRDAIIKRSRAGDDMMASGIVGMAA